MECSDGIDLPALQSVMCGSRSFEGAVSISFVSSRLSFCFMFLTLHKDALAGYHDEAALFPSEDSSAFTNTLSMIDLPSLCRIRGSGMGQFKNMNVVVLKSVCG